MFWNTQTKYSFFLYCQFVLGILLMFLLVLTRSKNELSYSHLMWITWWRLCDFVKKSMETAWFLRWSAYSHINKDKISSIASSYYHCLSMKSLPMFLGASLLVATPSPALAKEQEAWRELGEVLSHTITERVKEQTAVLLVSSPQAIQAITPDPVAGEVRVSRDADLPPSKITAKKVYLNTIRHDLTPNSRFVLGNSNGLRMGIEFNLSNSLGSTTEFGNAKLGVGILKNGLGVQYVSRF